MDAIGHFPRLWRALPRALRIKAATIATDDLDLGVLTEPHGCRRGRAIRKHVDDFAPFEIHHDRSVVHALEPAPLVYAQHAHFSSGPADDVVLQMPQDRVVARRKAEALHQPFGWPAAHAVSEQPDELGDPLGLMRVRPRNIGELLGSSSLSGEMDLLDWQHSCPQQFDAPAAEHGTVESFQSVDLAFGLTTAPWFGDRVPDGVDIAGQRPRELL